MSVNVVGRILRMATKNQGHSSSYNPLSHNCEGNLFNMTACYPHDYYLAKGEYLDGLNLFTWYQKRKAQEKLQIFVAFEDVGSYA